jgi:hypothetical protein
MGKVDLRDFNCTVNRPTSSWRVSQNFARRVVMELITTIKIPEEKDFAMKVMVQFAYRGIVSMQLHSDYRDKRTSRKPATPHRA